MYSSVSPSWRIVTSTPSVRAIVSTIALTLTGTHEPQHPVDGIVHVHEIDQVLAVPADDELALSRGEREQPSRRDLARRLVGTVRAEEAYVHVASEGVPALAEESDVLLGRELR